MFGVSMIIPSYGDGWELKSLKSEINNAVGKIKMYSTQIHMAKG